MNRSNDIKYKKSHNFMQKNHNNCTNLIKIKIIHTSHQNIISRKETSFIYNILFIFFYILKPIDFA